MFFFFSSRRRHTRLQGDWSSDVCSSDLVAGTPGISGACAQTGLRQGILRARAAGICAGRQRQVECEHGMETDVMDAFEPGAAARTMEIGRASCRERV